MNEHGLGSQSAIVTATLSAVEGLPHGLFTLRKYHLLDSRGLPLYEDQPDEVVEILNAYTNAGGAAALDLLIGTGTAFNAANAYIGVGDSSTANSVSFTDLQASTNKVRQAMDSTYPSRSGQVMTWKATFASGSANFAWNETALFNASSSGTMLCRTVTSFGTKTSAAAWSMTYTITVP